MSNFPKVKRRINGRLQYRAVQKLVEKRVAAGVKLLPVYEELVKAGRLTISYSSFWVYARGAGERLYPQEEKNTIYTCRVEFLAVQEEVEEKLDAGFNIRHIHNELIKDGKLTMSYPSFCEYLQGRGKRIYTRRTKKEITD